MSEEWKLFVSKEDLGHFLPEEAFTVLCDETGVTCKRPDNSVESVKWSDLRVVVIETNDQGPLYPDFFFLLIGESAGCIVPSAATGNGELLKRLQKLPGFDNEAVIQASISCDDNRFVCWKR